MKENIMNKDSLGDRIKSYESKYSQKLEPGVPWIARLDGKTFHSFTKGLDRPYDIKLSNLMRETAVELVRRTSAIVGYTQSDEITLCWTNKSENIYHEGYFAGKVNKINSVLASLCTLIFNKLLPDFLDTSYVGKNPLFDCRAFCVPSEMEAYNTFLWREKDAIRNSIQMAGRAHFSHKELDNKNCAEISEMLLQKGINYSDYPDFFKRGTFIRRKKEYIPFSTAEIDKLPKNHLAREDPNLLMKRSVLRIQSSSILSMMDDPLNWLFNEEWSK